MTKTLAHGVSRRGVLRIAAAGATAAIAVVVGVTRTEAACKTLGGFCSHDSQCCSN